MTVAELIRELQDTMDPDDQVYFTDWQRRCTTRRKIRAVHPCAGGVYLFAGSDNYLPTEDGNELEMYEGTRD